MRIHIVMYAWTVFWVAGALLTVVVFLESSRGDVPELVVGSLGLAAFFAICGGLVTVTYLAYQLSVEVRDRRLVIRSWLKVGPLGTNREIDLTHAESALILRPNFVEFVIPGATTRVWSMYRTVRDRDRFGTMWWFDEDYATLLALLPGLGIPSEYRDAAGLIGWVTSR